MRNRRPLAAGSLKLLLAAPFAADADESLEPLDTVVVTASKREQPLAAIDGAISVQSSEQLLAAGVVRTDELGKVFPELLIQDRSSRLFPSLTLRGVPSLDFYNPSIGVYVDGVAQDQSFLTQPLLDVQRVELLKGPQGTLYGSSAQSGVLNIVTASPRAELHSVAQGYVDSSAQSVAAKVGGGLADAWFADVQAGYADRRGSLTTSDGRRDADTGYGHDWRARLAYAPDARAFSAQLAYSRSEYASHEEYYLPFASASMRRAPPGIAEPELQRTVSTTAATLDYRWADWQLTSITSYQDRRHDRLIGGYGVEFPETQDTFTQELRFATQPAAQRRVDATVGAVYRDLDFTTHTRYLMPVPFGASESSTAITSQAVFGEATWHVAPRLDLTGGLRYSRERSEIAFERDGALPIYDFAFSGRETFSETTPKVALGFQAAKNLRLYALYSEGYKPGGFNRAGATAGNDVPYGAEQSRNYEIGLRGAAGSQGRLSFALATYRIDTDDVQLTVGAQGIQVLRNVGDARSEGLELNLQAQLVPAWTVGLSGSYSNSRFVRFSDPTRSVDYGDNRIPYSPRSSLRAFVEGDFSFDDIPGSWAPRLNVLRRGGFYFDPANLLRQDSYTVVDVQIAWRMSPTAEVALYGNNVTNRFYRVYAFQSGPQAFAQPGQQRSVGVMANLRW